jgi:hypothetical protein
MSYFFLTIVVPTGRFPVTLTTSAPPDYRSADTRAGYSEAVMVEIVQQEVVEMVQQEVAGKHDTWEISQLLCVSKCRVSAKFMPMKY